MSMMTLKEYLNDGWHAFYHQRIDGEIVNGYLTRMGISIPYSEVEIERLSKLLHIYEVTKIEGTPVIHIRKKL